MDTQYVNGTIYHDNHRQAFPPLPHIQSQYSQVPQQVSHTLPPLQPQRAALAFANDLFSQNPRSLQSSNAPQSGQFSDYVSHGQSRQLPVQAAYPPLLHQYSNTSAYISLPSHALSYDQNHTSALTQTSLPDIRSLPLSSINQPPILSTGYDSAPSYSVQSSTLEQLESPRTHVVGSQGRRGILPSAAGRPAAATVEGNSSAKSSVVPNKDVDGKYPCPHCNKTYLHAKHLKRHLLRHTGDRPYSCVLCNDTFSRSDILKRHFQKCSIRRGNPTGATHLSNSQSHLKKQGARNKSVSQAEEVNFSTDITPTMPTPAQSHEYSNGLGLGIQGVAESYQSASVPVSRSCSIKKSADAAMIRDKRSIAGPLPPAFKRSSLTITPSHPDSSLPSSTASTPLIMGSNRHSGQFSHSIHTDQISAEGFPHVSAMTLAPGYQSSNSISQSAGPSHLGGNGFDWTSFPADIKHATSSFSLPDTLHNAHMHVKLEPQDSKVPFSGLGQSQTDDLLSGLFETSSNTTPAAHDAYQHWNLHHFQVGAFHMKAQQLTSLCLASAPVRPNKESEDQLIKLCLTAENIEHFLDRYSHFQGHWPVLHMPTFNPIEAHDGLVLAMICIGAVYSDRLNLSQVRTLLSRAKDSIEQSSHIFGFVRGSPIEPDYLDRRGPHGLEEFQALLLLLTLAIWHGDSVQRQNAREGFQYYVQLARQLRMLQPTTQSSSTYSLLHQSSALYEHVSPDTWDWLAWVHQEKRSRIMYTIFLLDSALAMYFNSPPQLDPAEIKLPLPADDASWEAMNAHDCALALGLHGPAAQDGNVTGSRRRKQPEMHMAMKALLRPKYDFEPRCTNAYSKFILIHALHVHIWNVQKQLSQDNALYGLNEYGLLGNGNSTPVSQYDWIAMNNASTRTSKSNSGQATPTDSSGAQSPSTHQLLKATTTALTKWKKMWDDDLTLQYPPGSKRIGFCRDGIHFYWLAQMFLHQNRSSDWQAPPDSRFMQVLALLKQAKTYVPRPNTPNNEETGLVGDIDEQYGVADLTLDMKLLFTPLTPDYHTSAPAG